MGGVKDGEIFGRSPGNGGTSPAIWRCLATLVSQRVLKVAFKSPLDYLTSDCALATFLAFPVMSLMPSGRAESSQIYPILIVVYSILG
jgi:hypothetical protein